MGVVVSVSSSYSVVTVSLYRIVGSLHPITKRKSNLLIYFVEEQKRKEVKPKSLFYKGRKPKPRSYGGLMCHSLTSTLEEGEVTPVSY